MEPAHIKLEPKILDYVRRGGGWLGTLLLLLTLAGCLTSHAASLPEQESDISTASLRQSEANTTPILEAETAELRALPAESSSSVETRHQSPTCTDGQCQEEPSRDYEETAGRSLAVTMVPNTAVRTFQEVTETATATPTLTLKPTQEPTATAMPQSTDTPRPTDTPQPTDTPRPTATATARPTTVPATPAPFKAYAWVDNYYPAPHSVVTVHGMLFRNDRPVNGAQMGATWSYTHAEAYCTAYTGIDGKAACSQNIGAPLENYWVYIDVVFVHEDKLYYAKTGFVTDP